MLARMQDLFTEADRERVNAQMTSGTDAAYAALIAEDPAPSTARRVAVILGLGLIGVILAVVLGALLGSLGWVIGIAAAIVATAGGWPLAATLHRRSLRSRAREQVVGGYIDERGWSMVDPLDLLGSTPLLRAGDDRKTGWGIDGSIDGSRFCCGFYEYETREERTTTDSEGRTTTSTDVVKYAFTVAMLPIASPEFRNVSLGPGSFMNLGARFEALGSSMKRVELESSEFEEAYDMLVNEDADDVAIRQRFTPAVQMAFIERGITKDKIELEEGILLVARKGAPQKTDLGGLLDVLAEAVWIRAVLTEDPAGRLPDPGPLRALLLGE